MYNNVYYKETDTYDTKKKETTDYDNISSDNCSYSPDYQYGGLHLH